MDTGTEKKIAALAELPERELLARLVVLMGGVNEVLVEEHVARFHRPGLMARVRRALGVERR